MLMQVFNWPGDWCHKQVPRAARLNLNPPFLKPATVYLLYRINNTGYIKENMVVQQWHTGIFEQCGWHQPEGPEIGDRRPPMVAQEPTDMNTWLKPSKKIEGPSKTEESWTERIGSGLINEHNGVASIRLQSCWKPDRESPLSTCFTSLIPLVLSCFMQWGEFSQFFSHQVCSLL